MYNPNINKEKTMSDNEKLNEQILAEIRLSNEMTATLIRTLVAKRVFSQQDFLNQAAFGKGMGLGQIIFGIYKI